MNNRAQLLGAVDRNGTSAAVSAMIPESLDRPSLGYYLPLIQRLVRMRNEQGEGVIAALTAVSPGEGVSYVVESLSWELAKHTGEQILLSTSASLNNATPIHSRDTVAATNHRVQRLVDGFEKGHRQLPDLRREHLKAIRQRFGFALIDCPSMRESSAILSMGRASDGVILVVAAGTTRRDEVGHAQRVLEASSANLLGFVLNKRTYPVPGFLARFL
jgi:hypothetical protein